MLAGVEVAATSNEASCATFQNKQHAIEIQGCRVNVYDTVGLNTKLGLQAVAMLFKLIRDLACHDGIDFLVMVVQAPAIPTESMVANYELFHEVFCRGKVPILFVITGLEYKQPMERCWNNVRQVYERHGMRFAGHACITAIKGKRQTNGSYELQKEYDSSLQTLRDAFSALLARKAPWNEDPSVWFRWTLAYLLQHIAVLLDAPQATRQRLIASALVKHADLSKGEAKRIATCIVAKLEA
jgi:hypothetical protein